MEQNKGRSRARRIVIILLAAVMLISGGLSLHSYLEDKRTQEEYERLAELARETTAPVETETPRRLWRQSLRSRMFPPSILRN